MGTGVAPALERVGKKLTVQNMILVSRLARAADVFGFFRAHRVECALEKKGFNGQASRAISIGQLHTLLRFHLRPINVLVSNGPSGDRSPREISSWSGLPT